MAACLQAIVRQCGATALLATTGMSVQMRAEDKFIYTMPSAAELARSECLSVVFIYKLAILVIRNPRCTRPIATSIAD